MLEVEDDCDADSLAVRCRCASRRCSDGRDEDDEEADAAELARLLFDSMCSCGEGDARARFGERHAQDVSLGVAARLMDGVVTPGVAGMFWWARVAT